jgi:hypothetical protein
MWESLKRFGFTKIHPNVIICGLSSQTKLENAGQYLTEKDIKFEVFFDSDFNTVTALATEPLYGDRRSLLKKFQLLK